MKIFLLRHATAQPRRPNLTDSKRRLTAKGVAQMQAATRGLARLRVRPELVLSSPYRRAWDTAVLVARELCSNTDPVEFDALKPDSGPERIWADLKQYAGSPAVLLVGHEPLLGQFAAFLLNTPNLNISFKKAGLLRIDVLLTARQLSRLA